MQFKPYPEWKHLYEAVVPLIQAGMNAFSYEELGALVNLDMRSHRGRAQFYRFRRELLKTHQLWMENVPKSGYAVIPAKDQPHAAYRRVRQARRRVGMASAINTYIDIDKLTSEQRALQAATAAVLHELSKTFYAVGRRFQLASKKALKIGEQTDMPKLIESIEHKNG